MGNQTHRFEVKRCIMTHVAVLMGGSSNEREVSIVSGREVAKSLEILGFKVTKIDPDENLFSKLLSTKPDVVFNALHGRFGEDGTVQGLLEILRIPYTHSGVLASALAMNKIMSKKILIESGIKCTEGSVFNIDEVISKQVMDFPYVIKPINEGSSVGVNIILNNDNSILFSKNKWAHGDKVLVEKYVPGREITVAVLDDKPLGVTEIKSEGKFYDYASKYIDGNSKHLIPAPLSEKKYNEVLDISLAAHRALGCRSISRSDFRYDDTSSEGEIYLMEVNTQPGFTPNSLVPEIAKYNGISFEEIIDYLIKDASCDR